jgi:hypothetical protein
MKKPGTPVSRPPEPTTETVKSGVSVVTSKPSSNALNSDNTVTLAPVSKKNDLFPNDEAPLDAVALTNNAPCVIVGAVGFSSGLSMSKFAMFGR